MPGFGQVSSRPSVSKGGRSESAGASLHRDASATLRSRSLHWIAEASANGWLPALLLLIAVVLFANSQLFTTPIIEHTDYAANSRQIYHAKHFQELLGNYSRWRFHHPGPAYFYLLAAGEFILYDVLGIVPAAHNAQIVTIIIFNSFLLFASIRIFQRYCASLWFTPIATALALYFIYVVNTTVPLYNAALVSVWTPHMLMFTFLFFCVTSASLASGSLRDLPWVVLSGSMLVHGHVAQVLFAGVLGSAAICIAFGREWIKYRGWAWLAADRKIIGISIFIAVLFALPICIELMAHEPDNLDHIRAYTQTHSGAQNGLRTSIEYFFSYLLHIPDQEQVIKPAGTALAPQFLARAYARNYVAFLLAIAAMAVSVRVVKREQAPPFVRYALMVTGVASVLFLIWALNISGPLYNFNGFFIYSLQLIWLFSGAFVLSSAAPAVPPRFVIAGLTCAIVLQGTRFARLQNPYTGVPEIKRIADQVPRTSGVIQLAFDDMTWAHAEGISNALTRRGQTFCVGPEWAFSFGYGSACQPGVRGPRLLLAGKAIDACSHCVVLHKDSQFYAYYLPQRSLEMPIRIETKDFFEQKDGFHGFEPDGRWTRRQSSISFKLSPNSLGSSEYRVTLAGSTLPDRPARVVVNQTAIGTVPGATGGSWTYRIARNLLQDGGENRVEIIVDNAGPVGADSRELGFQFRSLTIEPAIAADR